MIQSLHDEHLIQAAEQMLEDSVLCWEAWDKLEVQRFDDCTITRSPIDFPFFNNIMGADISSRPARKRVKELFDVVSGKEKAVCWWLGHRHNPANLARLLEKEGASKVMENCLMAIELEALPEIDMPDGIRIVEVINEEQLIQWADIVGPAHDIPEPMRPYWAEVYAAAGYGPDSQITRHFLALSDGKAVGATTLITAAGVASVANVATDKDYRRQGIGRTLTFCPLKAAQQGGYKVACLSASPAGEPVYARLGFKRLGKNAAYLWMPPSG